MKSPQGRGLAYNAQSDHLHEKGGFMAYSIGWPAWSFLIAFWKLDVAFGASPASIEQIALRWMHIVAGFLWLGFLYFFVLAVAPTLKALDPATRAQRYFRKSLPGACGGCGGAPWSVGWRDSAIL